MPDVLGNVGTLVPRDNLSQFLPRALPWLEKTIADRVYEYWSLEEIVSQLQEGSMQLWCAHQDGKYFFVLTEVHRDRLGVVVELVLAGGELDEHKAVVNQISTIENWARRFVGAKSVVVWGRLGWLRLLRKHGYHFETAKYRRTLNDRMQ